MKNLKVYAFWIGISEVTCGLSALLTRKGMSEFSGAVIKPPLTPPPAAFGIVWGILFLLMGIGAARVYLSTATEWSMKGMKYYFLQLGANFLWTIVFFGPAIYGFAFFWLLLLLGLIIAMTVNFFRSDRTAGLLQLPYILWTAFAAYLNFGVWMLNR